MGLECAKGNSERNTMFRNSRADELMAEMRRLKGKISFSLTVTNLRIVDLEQPFEAIRLTGPSSFAIQAPRTEFHREDRALTSPHSYHSDLSTSIDQVPSLTLHLDIIQKKAQAPLDGLELELHEIVLGPIRHDHLLPKLSARILFDLHIDQYLQTDVLVRDFQVKWRKNEAAQRDYTYSLCLMFPRDKPSIRKSKKFQKHEKVKDLGINKEMIKGSDLQEATIKVQLRDEEGEFTFEMLMPFSNWQLLGVKEISRQNSAFQGRELQVVEKLEWKGVAMGEMKMKLCCLKSKLLVQQMDCLVSSEHGIVMSSPSQRIFNSKELDCAAVSDIFDRLKHRERDGLSPYQILQLLDEVQQTIDGRQFRVGEELFQIQQNLLGILNLLLDLVVCGNQFQNMYVWNICHLICHKEILNLKYFGSLRHLGSKKKFATKFYNFIIKGFLKIIESLQKRLTYKQLKVIHRFFAFAYFRFPWCQNQLLDVLARPTDPEVSEERLAEIGASYALKSPSKSPFYDWEGSVFSLIRRDSEFKEGIERLNSEAQKYPTWSRMLFDRQYDQLLYGIYFELWEEGQVFLHHNGRVRWEYFPYYGRLLSVFFGQMNKGAIHDFTPELTKCNMKLMKNQKLLNTFLMLIFPKTCLYETYGVIKCLELVKCYFNVVMEQHQKLPHDFRYGYFYSATRCLLESNHSYLLQQTLALIYKFYGIFSQDFKDRLSQYLMNKVFHHLFLHWSQDVRNLFHLLVFHRLLAKDPSQNPENNTNFPKRPRHKLSFNCSTGPIDQLYRLQTKQEESKRFKLNRNLPLHQNMKLKLKQKRRQRQESFMEPVPTLEKTYESDMFSPQKELPPIEGCRRKWSLTDQPQATFFTPSQQQLKYLGSALREFEKAKTEANPDGKVQEICKALDVQDQE